MRPQEAAVRNKSAGFCPSGAPVCLILMVVLLVGFSLVDVASAQPTTQRSEPNGEEQAQEKQATGENDRPTEQQQPEGDESPKERVRWDDGLWIEARGFDFRTKIGGSAPPRSSPTRR